MVKQRVEAANELTRYMALQSKLVESRIRLEKELLEMLGQIHNQIDLIEYCKQDLAFYTEWRKINPPVEDSKLKKEEAEKRKTLREFIGTAIREHVLETKEKGLLLMHMIYSIDENCETAATDGHRIFFGPKFLDELSDSELDFIMMH